MSEQVTGSAIPSPPEDARWFSLEVETKGGWAPIGSPEADQDRWWDLRTQGVAQVVAHVAGELARSQPDNYRALSGRWRCIWAPQDRRKSLGRSLPFHPEGGVRRAADESDAPSGFAAGNEEHVEGNGAAARVGAPARPSTPADDQASLRALGGPPAIASLAQAEASQSPLVNFAVIYQLARQDTALLQQQMLEAMRMIISTERGRADQAAQYAREHYRSLEQIHTHSAAQVESFRAQAAEQQQSQVKQLAQHLEQLGEKLQDSQSSDFEGTQSDVERLFVAAEKALNGILDSPFGDSIGQALAKRIAPDGGSVDTGGGGKAE